MLTSEQNAKVKQWKKLQKRKYREKWQSFIVEGDHLVEEAYKSDWVIEELIVSENRDVPDWTRDFTPIYVSEQIFTHISETPSPQGIAAIVRMKDMPVDKRNYLLLVDEIQDPGNLGTMIRTADAAGFDEVVLGRGTVDVFNDKVIRATQGSIFHIPIRKASLENEIPDLQKEDFTVWAAALENALPYYEQALPDKVALMIGNEGSGIKADYIDMSDTIVTIPIFGQAESLNASIASAILIYHIKTN